MDIQELVIKHKLAVTSKPGKPVTANLQGEALSKFCQEYLAIVGYTKLSEMLSDAFSSNALELAGPAIALFNGYSGRFCNLFGTVIVEAILIDIHDNYISYQQDDDDCDSDSVEKLEREWNNVADAMGVRRV